MSEDKKPKIDLKSRLGKKTVVGPGGPAVPPPVGGIPKPVLGGVPVPSLMQQAAKPAVKVDASDPYAAISATDAPRAAEPQAIKIEMSEEVVQAQKKAGQRAFLFAGIGAVIGIGIGYLVGGRAEAGRTNTLALSGAQQLKDDVTKANAEASAIAETLKNALDKIKANKFPEDEVKALGEQNIPFEGSTLASKGLGRFNARLATLLVQYAGATTEANDQKDKIRNILGFSKKGILDYLEQKEKPKVRWSIFAVSGPGGPWGVMQPVSEPFLVKDAATKDYKWPASIKINDGGKQVDLKRCDGSDCTGSTPKFIPIDPDTQQAVCPNDTISKLQRELGDMQEVFRGKAAEIPGEDDKPGLIKLGEQVLEELGKVGQPGSS